MVWLPLRITLAVSLESEYLSEYWISPAVNMIFKESSIPCSLFCLLGTGKPQAIGRPGNISYQQLCFVTGCKGASEIMKVGIEPVENTRLVTSRMLYEYVTCFSLEFRKVALSQHNCCVTCTKSS